MGGQSRSRTDRQVTQPSSFSSSEMSTATTRSPRASKDARVSGAALGYWLTGAHTFAGDDTALGPTQFSRFALMWLLTTAISTWAMGSIDDWFGLKWAWLAKPAVEVGLGVFGFVLSRHWVYKQ